MPAMINLTRLACDNHEKKISVQSGDFGDQGKRRLEKDHEGRKRWEGWKRCRDQFGKWSKVDVGECNINWLVTHFWTRHQEETDLLEKAKELYGPRSWSRLPKWYKHELSVRRIIFAHCSIMNGWRHAIRLSVRSTMRKVRMKRPRIKSKMIGTSKKQLLTPAVKFQFILKMIYCFTLSRRNVRLK